MNTVDKVLGFSLQEPFLWTNIYTRQKTPGMKSQAASRKKLPIMGSCTNTRNFDTGQIDATNRQLLHSSRPQIDMKTTRRITMRYTIYIETLRVKRLYHLIAHFEIVGADRRPHRNIQATYRSDGTVPYILTISSIDRRTICPAMPRHPA